VCVHIDPFLTTVTFPGVTLMVVKVDFVSVSVYQFVALLAFKPFLTYRFQVMVKAFLGFESSEAFIAFCWCWWAIAAVTQA
tara:strand:+ start:247 stop:489 length:243 start_codon:yes stop_codon:yes gene_type:complete